MSFKHALKFRYVGAVLWVTLSSPLFAAEKMSPLKGHLLAQLQGAAIMGRVPSTERVDLSLVVQLDTEMLERSLEEVYGHGAKEPRRFLSSAEFAQKFSLPEKRQRLKQFAQANGLTINPSEDRPDSMVVQMSGSAEVVEKAFNVQLNRYRATDGRVFRAHATEPIIPAALVPDVAAILGLSNLTNVARPHLKIGRKLTGRGSAAPLLNPQFSGTGPSSTISPSDIKTIYGLSSTPLIGAGQTVALFELDGYNPADITAYENAFGLTHVPLTFIGVGGTTNLCGGISCALQDPAIDTDMVEVALDIEMVAAVAPGLSRMLIYDGPNTFSGVINQYDKIATDNLASVVSTSWGLYELASGSAFGNAEAPIFQRMALQGQGVFAASGDLGAFDDGSTHSVDDPASQTYVTGVGGTTLTGTPGAHTETTWTGSGGGVSAVRTLPGYQSGVSGAASQHFRNVPDVSLNADPASGYAVYVGGSLFSVGGTSAAAPLWAAFMALVNQQRAADGNAALGFANPTLYSIGKSAAYGNLFTDITAGNNQFYVAGPGYDNATGLGSYKGSSLIDTLGLAITSIVNPTLMNIYAYPNPWDVRKNSIRQMTFANVPDGASAKVFTVSGFLVKNLPISNNHAVWDLTNESGQEVASGLYIYLITLNGNKVVGKVAVIR